MRSRLAVFAMTVVLCLASWRANSADSASTQTVRSFRLLNGICAIVIPIPDSGDVAVFTYLPMGLVLDGPGQCQWSHLLEHLVIRSTHPGDLQTVNAETLDDHMRLDFYGTKENWEAGIRCHARWIAGMPLAPETLEHEKQAVLHECDFVSKQFATHKFALAAWSQAFRHGRNSVYPKGDITRATLADMQQYHDTRMVVPSKAVICIVGGVPAEETGNTLVELIGPIKSEAKPAVPVELHKESRDVIWDMDARHLILTWPIPPASHKDYPGLLLAAQVLMVQLNGDPALQRAAGMTLVGADLALPEGNFFYVSASLRPDVEPDVVQRDIIARVQSFSRDGLSRMRVPMFGTQLAEQWSKFPDETQIGALVSPNVSRKMIEMNLGLQWGMREFQYDGQCAALAKELRTVKAESVEGVIGRYLKPDSVSCITLLPPPASR
jgi:hypothetical protein